MEEIWVGGVNIWKVYGDADGNGNGERWNGPKKRGTFGR